MARIEHANLSDDRIRNLELLDERLRWLSSWTVHNANHIREKTDGMKVGGHQASCASMSSIMSVLYFHALRPQDKVAAKPHAGPLLHAIHYLLGSQSLDQLQRFLGFGGMQSYTSSVDDDALAIATVMSATGSFDHRAIDGADGALLMKTFKELVESPLGLVA
jgi:pyruvate dehydrogenase E1 component